MHILKDKVAIVTGSSRGIGKAIAICFAGAGCNVVVNYFHSKDKALEVAQEIEERGHGGSLVIQADVSKKDDIERMVTKTVQRFGKIDILVNNAGIAYPYATARRQLFKHLEQTMICLHVTSRFHSDHNVGRPRITPLGWRRVCPY